jgi:hypothetical protein
MFFKHIIKILHVSVITVWPSSGGRLSCLVPLLHFRLFASSSCFIRYVAVCCLCVCGCVSDVLVCRMSGCEQVCVCPMYLSVGCLVVNCSQPDILQTSTSDTHTHTHTHGQHTATYWINNWTKQTSGNVVAPISTKYGPLRMVKQWWPKHVEF